MADDGAESKMIVASVFTITGRGLVASGVLRDWLLRVGDQVAVSHGSTEFVVTCEGVEMLTFPRGSGADPATVGVFLPALSREQVAVGDILRPIRD